jgi:D-serine dehydratase
VWTSVQSVPEPGLALLTGGRRDLSFDIELASTVGAGTAGRSCTPLPDDGSWHIRGLNDQHAHLRFDDVSALQPRVGDLVALGISHPCTTFDKWHWMPVVDDDYRIARRGDDALLTGLRAPVRPCSGPCTGCSKAARDPGCCWPARRAEGVGGKGTRRPA